MKVIMLLDNYFAPDIRVYKEAKYLVEKNINVEILCLDKKNICINKPEEEYDKIKIKRFFVRKENTTKLIEKNIVIRKIKRLIYLKWLIDFKRQVKQYLKNKEVDIIHCHDLIMALIACRYLDAKNIVFDMHENYAKSKNKIYNYFINKLVMYVQKRSKWIIYVNEPQVTNVKNKEKLIYLPNYPIEKMYLPIEKTKDETIRINYIGMIRDLNSLRNLANISNYKIGFYGEGSEAKTLKEEIKNKKNVICYGKYDGVNDSGDIYRNTDILYCMYNPDNQNWKKAYPVKSYEAIITETPIIVTKGTALGNFVEAKQIGKSVKYNDIKELEKAIEEIINNYDFYKKNISKIKHDYSWEKIIKNLDVIYKR